MKAVSRRARRTSRLAQFAMTAAVLVTILTWWYALSLIVGNDGILPSPQRVVEDFCAEFVYDPGLVYLGIKTPSYGLNIAWTLMLSLISWIIGGLSGMLVGLLASRIQAVRNAAGPLFYVFGSVPALVLAPFATIWFGHGPLVEVAIVSFYCFITVGMMSLSAGLTHSPETEEYAATLGASPRQLFWSIIFRGTLPENLVAMRIALAIAIAVQVTVELLGSQYGVGRIISVRASLGSVSAVLGMVLAVALVTLVFDATCRKVANAVTRWRE